MNFGDMLHLLKFVKMIFIKISLAAIKLSVSTFVKQFSSKLPKI